MANIESLMALLATIGVLGVGGQILIRSAAGILGDGAPGQALRSQVKQGTRGLGGHIISLIVGLVVLQEGVWMAYLLLV
ncbi:MAG: hypothetical protein Q7O66_09350 [Dehalococcoidia bacterium]|nr:hypothetical protein [Dehalococcoidia bacterium]